MDTGPRTKSSVELGRFFFGLAMCVTLTSTSRVQIDSTPISLGQSCLRWHTPATQ